MSTGNFGRHKFLQQKDPILLLEKISQHYFKGSLQVLSDSQSLALYFEDGKLIYACQSNSMWNLFYQKLEQLCPTFYELSNQLLDQLRALFDSQKNDEIGDRPDYLAICWLVEQQYLNPLQAGKLIEEIALGVLDSFLKLRDGIYKFIPESLSDYLPKFCHLDISLLARRCQLRSINLTNITNVTQPVNHHQVGLFGLGQQQLVMERQLVANSTNGSGVITQEVEYTSINNNEKDKKTKQKLYKVLCIDDSPIILKAIKNFLNEELFTVISVQDPLKALMQILHNKPDLILLDISMPKLDGYEVCSLLRKHPIFRSTPIVMVTGRTGFIDKARAKIVKSSGYLTKPFSKADLLKVVFSQIRD
ncbi:MAG: response regulator [Cyanomargarita calcarea GSE-NOS-MK-12-04C]|jgi:twitching motility two-component system response regulator PilG|uniref:Protein PatA n=1 Tax=Cyanomargarita calcarea GSE-NOS-MK-12-04C TaxID=2839659 RepID=A0A951QM38_9CYAN|nr:response regulator [Cyanomargarita calcarea GSE-NOS-MK-12-04C]